MSIERRFTQLDVFTDRALHGNPLAVVHGADGLGDERMAAFARWTNLSETTFLLEPTDPGSDYRVRIFTPTVELPFAGHPTLGSCHAWLAAGGRPRRDGEVVQQCGVGRVRIRRDGARLAFAAPPRRRSGRLDEAMVERIARFLQVPRAAILADQHCDNGPGWQAVMLASADAVLALRPQLGGESDLEVGVIGPVAGPGKVGVIGAHGAGAAEDPAFEVRAFFPASGGGLAEDPVTGSLNAALAQWLIGAGLAPPRYVAAQGAALGRAGRVHVAQDGDDIWIGGASVSCIEGHGALVSADLDHLVVAAASLDEGVRWCEATLGVTPGPGGKHPLMGTHNRLFEIGGDAFAQVFCEIIAIDPAAPAPGRARWFGLDTLEFAAGPRLVHVVARCRALDPLRAALRDLGHDIGPSIAASRDTPHGRLDWHIAVRDDGRLLAGGALPTLIDWGRTPHPTLSMPPSGVRLQALTLRGLSPGVASALGLPGVAVREAAGPAISATLDTSRGRVTLSSH